MKTAYYATKVVATPSGPGFENLPQFSKTLDIVAGAGNWFFGYCWQDSNGIPTFAVVKVRVPDTTMESDWAVAGVTLLGLNYTAMQKEASRDPRIASDAFGPRMSDPAL